MIGADLLNKNQLKVDFGMISIINNDEVVALFEPKLL